MAAITRSNRIEGSHPKRFKAQVGEWAKSKGPLLFISGNRHLSEVSQVPATQLGYPTFELSAGGMQEKLIPAFLFATRTPGKWPAWMGRTIT